MNETDGRTDYQDPHCGSCGADLDLGGHHPHCGNAGRYHGEEPEQLVEPTGGYSEDHDFVTSEPDAQNANGRMLPDSDDDDVDEPDEDDRPWDTREEHWGLR